MVNLSELLRRVGMVSSVAAVAALGLAGCDIEDPNDSGPEDFESSDEDEDEKHKGKDKSKDKHKDDEDKEEEEADKEELCPLAYTLGAWCENLFGDEAEECDPFYEVDEACALGDIDECVYVESLNDACRNMLGSASPECEQLAELETGCQ